MTGQQLRKELLEVNFGVKPTDREVSDTLARGIIRVVAQKHGLMIDMDSLGMESDTGEEEEETAAAAPDVSTSVEAEKAAPATPTGVQSRTEPVKQGSVAVLRKLSLEDVPKDAIARQQKELQRLSREEQDERQREGKAMAPRIKSTKTPGVGTTAQEQIKGKREGTVQIPDLISVKEFAEKTGIQVPVIMQALMKNGIMVTINQSIDYETAAIVAAELGVTVLRAARTTSAEHLSTRNLQELTRDDAENLSVRPPIVVVMGHVDHGKTAILDAIRETDVVSQEAGGITQHIGAYQVVLASGRKITFLDTPGHEAFTAMRARGAQIGDIAVLVVSAEEGVRPTTIEAIAHAKEANVPILVAINKIDKEHADPEKVKGELAGHGLQPEEWSGTTPMVLCSAVTKKGIDDLLEHILLMADLKELKANPNRSAVATAIESHMDTSLGSLATVVVNTGTLRIGDVFVAGVVTGKVKAMMDARGNRLQEVGPSAAVRIAGLDAPINVGDILQVVDDERAAKNLIARLSDVAAERGKRSFSDLITRLNEGKLKQLKIVLKVDAQGSLEALTEALAKLSGTMAMPKIIHAGVGAVSETDVMMAAASDGLVLAFHVSTPPEVLRTAEREGVKVREYLILYELLDEVSRLLEGLVEPEEEEKILGHLEVRGVFLTQKSGQIIGGKVTDGVIKRVPFRLQRAGAQVGTGRILSLKHVDKDIKEAKEGSECGMRVETTMPILEGDVLEVYLRELKKKEE